MDDPKTMTLRRYVNVTLSQLFVQFCSQFPFYLSGSYSVARTRWSL